MTGGPSDLLAAASREIDRLAERATAHHARLEQIRTDRSLSDEGKRSLTSQERQTFNAALEQVVRETRRRVDEAKTQASRRLSAPGDADTETRKARAAVRVSRLIDGGRGVAEAAELFAEAGDLDALRALRDEVPSWVAATQPTSEMYLRSQRTEQTLLQVDRVMAPLLSGEDAAAAQVRIETADDVLTRLTATFEHAVNNTPDSRVKLAYATPPAPEPTPTRAPSFGEALAAAQSVARPTATV